MGRRGYRTSSNHPLPGNSSTADFADLTSPGLFEGDMDVDLACSLLDDLGVDTTTADHTPAQTVRTSGGSRAV